MEKQNFSNNKAMEFYKAIKYLLQGEKIRRQSWGAGLYIKQQHNGELVYLYFEGESTRLITTDERFSLNDVIAKDWEIVE